MQRLALLITIVALSIDAIPARAAGPTAAPPIPASPDDVFAPGRLHTIHLRVTPKGWEMLPPTNDGTPSTQPTTEDAPHVEGERSPHGSSGLWFAYIRAQVEFDGHPLPDVGMRFKGNISYTASAGSPRRPIKLDFDRFVKGRHFAGLASLNLNNSAFDPSCAREAVAFALFRDMGVPAPRTSYALVYLTVPGTREKEYLGLYTLVEEVDKRFLRQHFAHPDGPLFKPEAMRGLPYLGEEWATYTSRYRPKRDVEPAWGRRTIELAKLVNRGDDVAFRERIGLYLDVDEFLRYVAVNSAIVNPDSFLSTGHNYLLYIDPADGRGRFLPWDMNLAFGGYSWVGTTEQTERTSVTRAYADRNRLVERVLAIDEYRRAYDRHLRHLIEGPMSPARMRGRQAELETVLAKAARAAKEAGKPDNPTTRPYVGWAGLFAPDFWPFVTRRVESIRLQLAGAQEGFRPGFRDPRIMPAGLAPAAPAGIAAMAALDTDADELVSEAEVTAGIERVFAMAHVAPNNTLDRAAVTNVFDQILPADLKQRRKPADWANWVFKNADANDAKKLTAHELLASYRRHRDGADREVDQLTGLREMLEALSGAGVPH